MLTKDYRPRTGNRANANDPLASGRIPKFLKEGGDKKEASHVSDALDVRSILVGRSSYCSQLRFHNCQ
jgi:hypothetical protein